MTQDVEVRFGSQGGVELLALFCGCSLTACSPAVAPVQDWMLEAFSTQGLGPTEFGGLEQNILSADGTAEYYSLNPGGVIDGDYPKHRTWEPKTADSFEIHADPDEAEIAGSDYVWVVHRNGVCGPHATDMTADGEPDGGGAPWYPGELCLQLLHCDGPPPCGYWEVVVCEGGQPPPAGCEEADSG